MLIDARCVRAFRWTRLVYGHRRRMMSLCAIQKAALHHEQDHGDDEQAGCLGVVGVGNRDEAGELSRHSR